MRSITYLTAILALSSSALAVVLPHAPSEVWATINFDSKKIPSYISFPGYNMTVPQAGTAIAGIRPHSGSKVAFNNIPIHSFTPGKQFSYPGSILAAKGTTFSLQSVYVGSTQGGDGLIIGWDTKGNTIGGNTFTCGSEMTLINLTSPINGLVSLAIIVQSSGENMGFAIDNLTVAEDA